MLKIEKIKNKEDVMVEVQRSCPNCGTYGECKVTGKSSRYQMHCCTCDCLKRGLPDYYASPLF